MTWLQKRQSILAENIANLSTPGYVPQDAPDFVSTLQNAAGSLTRTNPLHLPALPSPSLDLLEKQQVAPDGNAVTMEDQLTKVADTEFASPARHRHLPPISEYVQLGARTSNVIDEGRSWTLIRLSQSPQAAWQLSPHVYGLSLRTWLTRIPPHPLLVVTRIGGKRSRSPRLSTQNWVSIALKRPHQGRT